VLNAEMARDRELLCHAHMCHELRASQTRHIYPTWRGIASCYVIMSQTHTSRTTCVTHSIYICILQVDIASRWGRPKSCMPKWREIASCYTTHTCVTKYMHHELNTLIRNDAGSRAGNTSQKVRSIVILYSSDLTFENF